MSDAITDRIAAIIEEHLICGCGEWAEDLGEASRHIADVIVEQLGLTQQWGAAGHAPHAPVPYFQSVDQRSDAEVDAAEIDGFVVNRYVTKWEATDA